jgi:hypothetical protein
MSCERLKKWIVGFAFVTACGREQPAPPPATETRAATPPPITVRSVTPTPPAAASPAAASYDEAMVWLRSAPHFRFTIDEGGVHAEGTMTRPTVGSEKVDFTANGVEWRAAAGPRGIAWQKRKGASWVAANAPDYGNHLYQRATLVFDPAKKEGAPQATPGDNGTTLFRFTDANSGKAHEVRVRAGNQVERITIAGVMDMTIQP